MDLYVESGAMPGINYMVMKKQELKLKIEIETVCISMLSPLTP